MNRILPLSISYPSTEVGALRQLQGTIGRYLRVHANTIDNAPLKFRDRAIFSSLAAYYQVKLDKVI